MRGPSDWRSFEPLARLAVAAALLGAAAVVVVVYLSKEHDCVHGEGIKEWGGAFGSLLAACGVVALVWM